MNDASSDLAMRAEQLLDEARDKTGLSDFGDQDFIVGLELLLDSYQCNGFTASAQRSLRSRVLKLLIGRLHIQAALLEHPDIAEQQIIKPLFLTGMPRTGTSALLNVLANDPAFRELKLWEAHNPWPQQGLEAGQVDPRYLATKRYYDNMNRRSDFKKIHHMTADSAEECVFLTNHTFQDAQYGFESLLEPYASYYEAVDRWPQYRYHADCLRMLQWQRPGGRWLLKTPSHICHLDIIAQLHPSASMIVTHRNPVEVIGSFSSMMLTVMPEQAERKPHEIGRRVLDLLAGQIEQSMQARESIDPARIVDVDYLAFTEDTLAVVEAIYAKLGLSYSADVQARLRSYVEQHPRGKHGRHNYNLAAFGLSERQVLDRFEAYIDTYAIAV